MSFLYLLFIKHYIIDFVMQTDEMVKQKGTYGAKMGLWHSGQHAIATMMVAILFFSIPSAIIIGLLDGIIHYHIDYIKMRYGCRDVTKPQFWNQLGLDQLAHALTYLSFAKLFLI